MIRERPTLEHLKPAPPRADTPHETGDAAGHSSGDAAGHSGATVVRRLIPLRPQLLDRDATATCQPAADAACSHCSDCREAEARRFDEALRERLEAVTRAARLVC